MGYAQRMGLGKIAPPDSAMEEVVEQQRVRELAAAIRDEAHLQQILDDVQPQSLRTLVEAQIRPWCAFPAIVTITPTDPTDAEPATILEIVINREILDQEIADLIQPAWRPVVPDPGGGPPIALEIQTGNGQPFKINRPYDTGEIDPNPELASLGLRPIEYISLDAMKQRYPEPAPDDLRTMLDAPSVQPADPESFTRRAGRIDDLAGPIE